ncbi:hypothetical protein Bca4012_011007 [Brassica carinata]|uniref:Uncharacterized protein n=1 Tax=Brassica carinata TaxID=52824 RepID=A0A8X7S482_BRACI|nr:hypothetical protein Bca52824_035900 [Brassica carinata]
METANREEVEESPLSLTVANKEGDSADEKNQSEAESESAKKVKEGDQDDEVVVVGSSSEDITVKEGRKKRVLKRLRLHSSKQQKTSASSTLIQSHFLQPEDAAKSPFLAQGRSKRAFEQGTTSVTGVNKKSYDQFYKCKGYLAVIKKSSMESIVFSLGSYVEQVVAEFYAGLPDTKIEADTEEVAVKKQHHVPSRTGDKVERAIAYKKDKCVGETYEQRKVKGKGRARDEPKGRTYALSSRLPSPSPPAPTSSSKSVPRRVSIYELGSVAIPKGPLTQADLQEALEDTS